MADGPTTEQARPTEEGVGTIWRVLGIPAVVAGITVIGLAVWDQFASGRLQKKGFAILCVVGAGLVYLGVMWIRGKKVVDESVRLDDDTVYAGRGNRLVKWPADVHAIIDELRPALLTTGGWFDLGVEDDDKRKPPERPRARIGWTKWSSASDDQRKVLAFLRPAEGGGIELHLRLGADSPLLGPQGRLLPSTEGGPEASAEFGMIVLRSADVPPEVPDWIATAGEFTRNKFKIDRKGRKLKG